jgi:hypothetical protein
MQDYVANRTCGCTRCRWNGLLGPALLVAVGALMLLHNLRVGEFQRTWPVLLIVIGAVKLLQTTGPTQGHRPSGAAPLAPAAVETPAGIPEVSHE